MSLFAKLFSRGTLRQVHITLGLVCSIVFAIVVATGALYLYRDEIARGYEPDRYYSQRGTGADRMVLDALVSKVEGKTSGRAETIVLPSDPRRSIRLMLKSEELSSRNRRIMCDVDPYDGTILGFGADKLSTFFMGVRRWHTRLNLPKRIGRPLVDVSCAVMVVLLLSGLRLWFPARRLTVAWRTNVRRILFDAHSAVGIYTLVPLLILSVTGLIFAFGEVHSDYALRVAMDRAEGASEPSGDARDLESIVRYCLDDSHADAAKLTIPADPGAGPLIVEATRSGLFSFCAPTVYYWNTADWTLAKKTTFSDLTAKGKFNAIVRECHFGDVFGEGSKFIFLLGLLGAEALTISGVFIGMLKGKSSNTRSSNGGKEPAETKSESAPNGV